MRNGGKRKHLSIRFHHKDADAETAMEAETETERTKRERVEKDRDREAFVSEFHRRFGEMRFMSRKTKWTEMRRQSIGKINKRKEKKTRRR